MTPAGIEAATFRFVAQRLNHCATAAPFKRQHILNIESQFSNKIEVYQIVYFTITSYELRTRRPNDQTERQIYRP